MRSTNRIWLDLGVSVFLLGLLIFGGMLIYELNFDAMEVDIDDALAQRGQEISTEKGCIACHTVDGSPGVGPSWMGMFGRVETLDDDSSQIVDELYFRESIHRQAKAFCDVCPNEIHHFPRFF